MPINSKQKGKRGELEAVRFLKSLGFTDARRTAQYCGADGDGDVVCPDTLPDVHFEVKFGYPPTTLDVGTSALMDACKQAIRDGGGKPWVVLWRPKHRTVWRMTVQIWQGQGLWTTADPDTIAGWLWRQQETAG